jgi:hypothetical protein
MKRVLRTFMVEPELWDRVTAKAEREGVPVSRVIRSLLEAWVDKPARVYTGYLEAAEEVRVQG